MKKDNQITDSPQTIVYKESMRELGAFRFIIGGIILFFAAFFFWIEMYIVGSIITITGLLVMEYCSEIIVDKDSMLLIKKAGLFVPFLTIKRKSILGAVSVSINKITTRHRSFGEKMSSAKTSYQLFFDLPGKKILINTFSEKGNANKFAEEIEAMLNLISYSKST
jgi:hypothetical protein